MKPQIYFKLTCILILILLANASFSQLPVEQPLWPNGIENNPVKYPEEKVNIGKIRASSLSQNARVYSCVSNPTFEIIKPEKPNGVAIVICPGGGFREVGVDREGTDLALFLAKYGITSMVLKYRTYNTGYDSFTMPYLDYVYHVYADAKQAIYMLRKKSKELGLDSTKIGIGGFSAGGALALGTAIEVGDNKLPAYAKNLKENARPDFACLIYPGIHPDFIKAIDACKNIPPMFIINGREDTKTPAKNCIDLFTALNNKNAKVELHIYGKGDHGFDSGLERGNGVGTWRDSFIAWLRDMEIINNVN